MARLKLDQDLLGVSSILERMMRVRIKDCFQEDDTVYVVVHPGDLGKAVGKGGIVIKSVQEKLKKNIRVIEFRDDLVSFVQNVIYPIKVEDIVEEEGKLIIKDQDKRVKSKLIGRDGKNLAVIKRAVSRFFPGREIKIE